MVEPRVAGSGAHAIRRSRKRAASRNYWIRSATSSCVWVGTPILLALLLLLFFSGCSVSPLAKHTAEFSTATNAVVDSSENAYRAAVRLHDDEQLSAAVQKYDANQPWDPHSIKHAHRRQAASRHAPTSSTASRPTPRPSPTSPTAGDSDSTRCCGGLRRHQPSSRWARAINPDSINRYSHRSAIWLHHTSPGSQRRQHRPQSPRRLPREQEGKVRSPQSHPRHGSARLKSISSLLDSDVTILRRQSADDYEQLLMQQDTFIRKFGPDTLPHRAPRRDQRSSAKSSSPARKPPTTCSHELQDRPQIQLAETHHALAAAAQSKDTAALQRA